jgi:hypothetical protein
MTTRSVPIMAGMALLLASAAAQAEDAVVPDEFELQQQSVGACDAYGKGFARLPGTNTCARVSGHVRVEKKISRGGGRIGGQTVLDFETRTD